MSKEPMDEDLRKLLNDVEAAEEDTTVQPPVPDSSSRSGRRRQGARQYRSALSENQTDRRKTARVTGKKAVVAGQYLRRSFTFRPDQLDSIERLAGRLGLSQNDLVRWFTDMGTDAVEAGVRPPVTEEVKHRYAPD